MRSSSNAFRAGGPGGHLPRFLPIFVTTCLLSFMAFSQTAAAETAPSAEREKLERGRYLVQIGACNDCHTRGFFEFDGNVPESAWLTGSDLGWRGPWGTTYAPNLRRLMASLSEDKWVVMARNLKSRPPMPWFNLRAFSEDDLRAMHLFVRHLGPSSEPVPEYVPPEGKPVTPYVSFPQPPG